MAQQLSFTTVIEHAAKLPFVHVNREEFLSKNLSKLCTMGATSPERKLVGKER